MSVLHREEQTESNPGGSVPHDSIESRRKKLSTKSGESEKLGLAESEVRATGTTFPCFEQEVVADMVGKVFNLQSQVYDQEASSSMRDMIAYRAMMISSLGTMHLCSHAAKGTLVDQVYQSTLTNCKERIQACAVKLERIIQDRHFDASQYLEHMNLEIVAALGVTEHVGHVQGYVGTRYPKASVVFTNTMKCVARSSTEDAMLQPIIDSIAQRIRREEPGQTANVR
jgi:hypothetical protein